MPGYNLEINGFPQWSYTITDNLSISNSCIQEGIKGEGWKLNLYLCLYIILWRCIRGMEAELHLFFMSSLGEDGELHTLETITKWCTLYQFDSVVCVQETTSSCDRLLLSIDLHVTSTLIFPYLSGCWRTRCTVKCWKSSIVWDRK
jgi:hypothetical protein